MSKEISIGMNELLDIAIEAKVKPHDAFFGKGDDDWMKYSKWTLGALKDQGMKPEHKLLDVGCGSLRLAMLAVPYLNDGNYCGVEAFAQSLDFGKKLMEHFGIKKKYQAIHSTTFEFDKFNMKVDFAMAQSVITHLSLEQTELCLKNMKKVMNPGGKFIFTFIPRAHARGYLYEGRQAMIRPGKCDVPFLERMAKKFGLKLTLVDMNHPSQRTGIYEFP